MKILFLISSMGVGGAERVAATLCNQWSTAGHSVYLIPTYSGGGESEYDLNPSIKIQFLANFLKRKNIITASYFWRLIILRKLIRKIEPDVIVSFLPNVNIASILTAGLTDIPLIISERRDPSSQRLSFLWEMACRLLYRFASAVVVQTDGVQSNIKRFYPGLKNVICIPNPIPSELLLLQPRENNSPRKVLLSLGRLSPEKQIDHIIRCFSKIANNFIEWELHVYGEGPSRQDLERLTIDLNLSNRIIFKGRSNDPWGVMSKADAFVMTSRFEGFPNALLEAMAMGLPCISYDCPSGPRDISREGTDALLVPPQDEKQLLHQISRLLNNSKLSHDLGQRARASVIHRYKSDVILKRWDALFIALGLSVDIL